MKVTRRHIGWHGSKALTALLVACCAAVLAFSLAGCGGNNGGGAVAKKEPAANEHPRMLETCGPNDFGDPSGSNDMWYVDGDKSKGGLFFENFYYPQAVFVDADGTITEPGSSKVEDKHLRPESTDVRDYDIVFNDAMTCYDYVTETWYLRGDGDVAKYEKLVADTSWADKDDPDNNYFTLNADGTVDAGPKCSNFEKWKVTAVDRITIFFKSYDYENADGGHFIYDFYYDGDKVVKLDWGDGVVGCYLRK